MIIKHLKVRNVRGIGPLGPDLAFEKPNTMICGENGTGKSSYVDALEYVLTRQSSSLDIGKRGVSWDLGGRHILSTVPTTIEMTLSQADGTEHTVDLTSNLDGFAEPVHSWLQRARRDKFVLRRRSMLEFLEADPRLRYDALEAFLALDEYQKLEQRLRDVAQTLASNQQTAVADISSAVAGLRSSLNLVGEPSTQAVLNAYNTFLTTRGWAALSTMEDLPRLQREVQAEIESFGDVDRATKLQAALTSLAQVPAVDGILVELQATEKAFAHHDEVAAQITKGFYPEVLEQGLKWIKDLGLDYCPLCEREFDDREASLKRIQLRLEENAEFIRARKALQDRLDSVNRRLTELVQAYRLVAQSLKAVDLASGTPEGILNVLASLQSNYMSGKPSDNRAAEQRDNLNALNLAAVRADLEREVLASLQALPGLDRYRLLSDIHRVTLSTLTNFAALTEAQMRHQVVAAHKRQVDLLVELATKGRKDAVQQAVEEVASEANRLYVKIHPDETIGGARLTVPNRGQGSLDLDASFHNKRADPRLLLSESHLDTLGLCFFLAVRRLNAIRYPYFKLLVLDDVLHSVDAAHRQRTAEMLLEEFGDHQMFITTHDPLWFQRFRSVSSRKGVLFTFKRIGGWSLQTGPQWGDFQSDYEFLKGALDTGRVEDVAASAGRLMEEVLQNVCEQLRLAVPFRRSARYEIGVLWDPFYKAAKKQQGFWTRAEMVCTELDSYLWVRNETGAHFNPSPIPASPTEVKAFAKAARSLAELVNCPQCGQFVQEVDAPAGNWTCRCGKFTYTKKLLAATL